MKIKKVPTVEQIDSIRLFAMANGRSWKSELRMVWQTGNYNDVNLGGSSIAHLQQIRNSFGPSWLVNFKIS